MKLVWTKLHLVILSLGIANIIAAEQHPLYTPDYEKSQGFQVILSDIQSRFHKLQSLECDFSAESKNATTGIIDQMEGKLWIRFPEQMRWEYKKPKQTVIFDGKQLFIYFVDDNQVFTGLGSSISGINLIFTFFTDTNKIKEQFRGTVSPHNQKNGLNMSLVDLKQLPCFGMSKINGSDN